MYLLTCGYSSSAVGKRVVSWENISANYCNSSKSFSGQDTYPCMLNWNTCCLVCVVVLSKKLQHVCRCSLPLLLPIIILDLNGHGRIELCFFKKPVPWLQLICLKSISIRLFRRRLLVYYSIKTSVSGVLNMVLNVTPLIFVWFPLLYYGNGAAHSKNILQCLETLPLFQSTR